MKRITSIIMVTILIFCIVPFNEVSAVGVDGEEFEDTARYILTDTVVAENPERFGMNADAISINNWFYDSSFEPMTIRVSYWTKGNGTEERYGESIPFVEARHLSSWGAFRDGFFDGANVRVYRFNTNSPKHYNENGQLVTNYDSTIYEGEETELILKGTIREYKTVHGQGFFVDGAWVNDEYGRVYLEDVEYSEGFNGKDNEIQYNDYMFVEFKDKDEMDLTEIGPNLDYILQTGGETWSFGQNGLHSSLIWKWEGWNNTDLIYRLGDNKWISGSNAKPYYPTDDRFGQVDWHISNNLVKYGDNKRVRYEGEATTVNPYFKTDDGSELIVTKPISAEGEEFGKTFMRLHNYIDHPNSAVRLWSYRFGIISDYGESLVENVDYTVDMWLRTEESDEIKDVGFTVSGMGEVTLTSDSSPRGAYVVDDENSYKDTIVFKGVTNEWKKYSATFRVEHDYKGDGGMYAIMFKGAGAVYIDNANLYEAEYKGVEYKANEVRREYVKEINDYKGGAMRIWAAHNNTQGGVSMDSALNLDYLRNARFTGDGARTHTDTFKIPAALNVLYKTGDEPETRTNPWFIVGPFMDETEWRDIVAYLAGDMTPLENGDVDGYPGGKLHPYVERRQNHLKEFGIISNINQDFHWVDQFEKIYIEVSNETWHSHFGWSMSGSEHGLLARYFLEEMKKSPYYEKLQSRLVFVVNGWVAGEFGSEAVKALMYSSQRQSSLKEDPMVMVDTTTYIGGWEAGTMTGGKELTRTGIREWLAYPHHYGNVNSKNFAHRRDELNREIKERLADDTDSIPEIKAGVYEGGPSYDLPSPGSPPNDLGELYGKSMAAGIATLEEFLFCSYNNFYAQGFYQFGGGTDWKSNSQSAYGFLPHTSNLALQIRNRYVTGDMTQKLDIFTPTIDFTAMGTTYYGEETEVVYRNSPLTDTYSFYDSERNAFSVFVISRKLEENTTVKLYLPFESAENITQYTLARGDGSPAEPLDNNIGAQRMDTEGKMIYLKNEQGEFLDKSRQVRDYFRDAWGNFFDKDGNSVDGIVWNTELNEFHLNGSRVDFGELVVDPVITGQMVHIKKKTDKDNDWRDDKDGEFDEHAFILKAGPATVLCYVFEGITMRGENYISAYLDYDNRQKTPSSEPVVYFNLVFDKSFDYSKYGCSSTVEFIEKNIVTVESSAKPLMLDVTQIDEQKYTIALSEFQQAGSVKVEFSDFFKSEFRYITFNDELQYFKEDTLFFHEDWEGENRFTNITQDKEAIHIEDKSDEDYKALGLNSLATNGSYVINGAGAIGFTCDMNFDLMVKALENYVQPRKVFSTLENNRLGGLIDKLLIGRPGTSLWLSAFMRKDDLYMGFGQTDQHNALKLYLNNGVDNRNILEFGCLGNISTPHYWPVIDDENKEYVTYKQNGGRDEAWDWPNEEGYYWTLSLPEIIPTTHKAVEQSKQEVFPYDNTRVIRTNKKIILGETIFVAIHIKFNPFEKGDEVFVYINPPLIGELPKPDAYVKTDWETLYEPVHAASKMGNFNDYYDGSELKEGYYKDENGSIRDTDGKYIIDAYGFLLTDDGKRIPDEEIIPFSVPYERSLAFSNLGFYMGHYRPDYGDSASGSIGEIRMGSSFKAVAPQADLSFSSAYSQEHGITGINIAGINGAIFDNWLIFATYDEKNMVSEIRNVPFNVNNKVNDVTEINVDFSDNPIKKTVGGKIKAFIWDELTNMIPVYESSFDVD